MSGGGQGKQRGWRRSGLRERPLAWAGSSSGRACCCHWRPLSPSLSPSSLLHSHASAIIVPSRVSLALAPHSSLIFGLFTFYFLGSRSHSSCLWGSSKFPLGWVFAGHLSPPLRCRGSFLHLLWAVRLIIRDVFIFARVVVQLVEL